MHPCPLRTLGFYLHRRDALVKLWESLREAYEDWLWKYGPDRKELAAERLAAHKQAILNGTPSPYTHPEIGF